MKKLLILCIGWALISLQGVYAQSVTLTGRVIDAENGAPIPAATVKVLTLQSTTDAQGNFSIPGVNAGTVNVEISAIGYVSKILDTVTTSGNLGNIMLIGSAGQEMAMGGIAEVSLADLEMDEDSRSQNISGLLGATNDAFLAAAQYTFSSAYFRMRGYDADLNSTYISSSPINDAETGRTLWALWGGLNDATRNKESVNGLAPANFSFGNVGSATNIITRPTQQRIQSRLTYSLSNRTYVHRTMFTHSTGLLPNNWAFTFSVSKRWGNGGYVPATYYDAYAWFGAVERKLSDKHSVSLTALGAPVKRGMQGGAVQEVYDLMETNFYNPNWGYQNGEVRNARIREMNQPIVIANHYWTPSASTQITSALSYLFGRTGTTALNWYNSADPRPNYYRKLPSYFPDSLYDAGIAQTIGQNWVNNTAVSQIDWNQLYQANYYANLNDKQARYIIEDRRNDQNNIAFSSYLTHSFTEKVKLNGGLELNKYKVHYFKTISDLLGGTYWVDVDQFAERDFAGNDTIRQNDLLNPNRVVKEGDKFGYDYNLHQEKGSLWTTLSFNTRRVDYYAGVQLTGTSFWREGFMKNGRYPDNSYGNSDKHNFFDYAVKGGATLKISGRHFVEGNAVLMTEAPFMRNSFISPRVRDHVVPDIKSGNIYGGELSYHLRDPLFKARITVYHTVFEGQSEVMGFYHDDYRTFVNQAIFGINKTHQGLEFGADYKFTPRLSVNLAANYGNYRYTNRPQATISFENGSMPDVTKTVYMKNFYVAGTPQTAASAGLRYAGPRYLYLNANVNYYDRNYLDFNAERRTQTGIANLGPGDPRISIITAQEKAPSGYTVDASLGKSWRIQGRYFLNLNASMTNILDNKSLRTGGYEQLRFDFETKNVNKYPPVYYYAYGRTFFLNLGFRF